MCRLQDIFMTDTEKPKKAKDDFATVFDLNAVGKKDGKDVVRTHSVITARSGDVVDTKSYDLNAEKGTKMPLSHAMQFLHPGFRVIGADGKVIKPVEKRERIVVPVQLKADELLACIDELSDEALFKRAKILPMSEYIDLDTDRDKMIAFIVNHNERHDSPQVGLHRDPGAAPEMAESAINQLMGDKVLM